MIYVTFYQYAAGKIVLERKQVPQDENGKYTFDMSSVTVPAPKTTLKFMGWSMAQGTDASEQEGDTVGSCPLLNNGVVEFTEDTDVYPVYYSGIWIVFVSADTGMGATYVPSYFISADSINASAAKPTDPAMTGYEFDGWFTAPESKEDYIPAETGGSFNFNTSFEDLAGYTNDRGEVVLYGHWKGGDTTYVVYWKQQVGNSKTAVDSEKTYDYAGQTDPISGTTGFVPTPTAAQQAADTGFKYSRYELVDVKDDGTTVASGGIKADGSSILNVYFDRKMIYFRFRANTYANYNGNWTSSSYATTYTGLYGQTWQQADYTTNWPAPGGSNRWGYYAAGNTTIGMSYLGQFIPPEDVRDTNGVDVRFYYSGTSSYTVNLYVQNADGSWPATTNISGRTGGNFNLTDKLEGFYVSAYRVGNSGNWTNVSHTTNADGTHSYNPASVNNIGSGPLNLRYARESYDILYLNPLNENKVLDPQNVLFGASLASAKPNVSSVDLGVAGYEWDGKWYKDKNCTTEFDFNSEPMPMGGTKVYAGKTPLYFYIKIDPNGGELQTGQSTWRWVRYGDDTTYTYDNITRDYIEYKGSGTAYYYYYDEFNINRRDDIWNYTYMASNPRTARYTTGEIPAGGGSAWLGTDQFSHEADAYSLIGWYDVTDGTDNMKPFKSGTAITRDTIIEAQWRRTGEYSVLYHIEAVDETGADLIDTKTGQRVTGADNPVDGAKYADKSDSAILDKIGVVPAGYSFVGWYYNGKIYQPGDVFQVLARLSDDNKTVHIYPVMETVETLPVEVIDITYDPNGGVFTDDADTELNAMITAAKENSEGASYNPKLTTNSDGTKTISDLQINEGLELLSADAVQNGVEINGEKVLGRGFRLKEWNTEADGTGTRFALNTRIGVDDKEPVPNKVYAIWEKVFYVYHPATGKFQTLVNGDSTDRWALTTVGCSLCKGKL